MTMPNFLIIGAGKSGTTSLYHYLRQHPEVYMSPVKEPKFFAVEGKELNFRGPNDETSMNRGSITSIEAYRGLFREVTDEKAIGEASPLYLHSLEAPGRIKHYIPEARLIAVLRDPVQRAYSSFLQRVQKGQEPLHDFAQALREEENRMRDNWAPRWYSKRIGFYYAHLKRYYDLFEHDRIRVYLHEDLKADPVGVARDVVRFLGVNDAFTPDISLRYNVSGVPRSAALQAFLSRPNPAKSLLKRFLSEDLRRRVAVSLENRNIAGPPPPLDPNVRKELQDLYREDILNLEKLIGRDLSRWLE
jgi:hypothetical protein